MTYAIRDFATAGGTTTATVTVPAAATAGDMMLLLVGSGSTPLTSGNPSGWTVLSTNHTYQKTSDGTEGGTTITVTSGLAPVELTVVVMVGWPPLWQASSAVVTSTSSTTGFAAVITGDLVLINIYKNSGSKTLGVSSTTFGTPAIDAQRTTDTNGSLVLAHTTATTTAVFGTGFTMTSSPSGGNYQYTALALGNFSPAAAAGGSAVVTLPINIAGVTATETTAAAAATSVTLTASPTITASTSATVTVTTDAGTFSLDDVGVTIYGEPAEVTSVAQTGYVYKQGTVRGDDFNYPIEVSGAGTQSVYVDLAHATIQSGEPDPIWDSTKTAPTDQGTFLQATMWIRYTPYDNGTLTVSGPTAADEYEFEIFDGDTLDSLTRVGMSYYAVPPGTAPTPLAYDVTSGVPIYIRVWATSYTWQSSPYSVTMTLSFVADATQHGSLVLDVLTPEFSVSPGVIRVNAIGGTASSALAFDLLGTSAAFANPPGIGLGSSVASYTADTSGNLYGATIPLPTVSAGTYTVRVRDTTAGTAADGVVQVDADPITPPATIPPDNPIGAVTTGTTVINWTLEDPAPSGLGAYVFPINPSTMTTPHAPRNVTIDHTVAVDGNDIIWEGAYKANEWHFQGVVLTQAFYEKLVAFTELNRRFWITDHRLRGWVCSIESIAWTKHRDPYNDWSWDYDITALIYQGPVNL